MKLLTCLIGTIVVGLTGCITVNPTYSSLSKTEQAKRLPAEFSPSHNSIVSNETPDAVVLNSIDSTQLQSLLVRSDKPLKWVLIYTDACKGTPLILPYFADAIKRHKNVDGILVSSNDYSNTPELRKVLSKYGLGQSYIINNSYGEYKDGRMKGFLLRNQLCVPCRAGDIGVPYNIVFDADNKIIWHGYRSYDNNYVGEDFLAKLGAQ